MMKLERIRVGVVATVCLLHPLTTSAATPRFVRRVEQRIVFSVAPVAAEETFVVGLPNGGMLSRFAVDLVAGSDEWDVVFAAGSAGRLARLGHNARVMSLPRPLGFRLEVGDSVTVHVRVRSATAQPVQLRVVIEYETLDAALSRLPILPVALGAAPTRPGESRARSWEWQATIGGRLMAVAGLAMLSAAELILQDVESGAVLWRETVQAGPQQAFGGTAGVVRAGVALQRGRSYRLTVIGDLDAIDGATELSIQAMLLPAREIAAVPGAK